MADKYRAFRFGGKTYQIRFTQNALYKLQKATDQTISQWFAEHNQSGGGVQEANINIGPVDVQVLLWAGMEGQRIKAGKRTQPYNIFEVGDLAEDIFDGGGDVVDDESNKAISITLLVMEALLAALAPIYQKPVTDALEKEAAAADAGPDPTPDKDGGF